MTAKTQEQEFKQTEIGEIPAEWDFSPIGDSDVALINMGQSPASSTYNTQKMGLPFYQGKADFGLRNPIPTKWCSEPAKIAEPDDILLSVRAPVGDVNIANERCCIGRGITAIRASSKSHANYLFYAMLFSKSRLDSLGNGAIFKAINKETLVNFSIPLPGKPEQDKIAFVLSEIQKAVETQEKIVAGLKELKAATMEKLFREGTRGEPLKQSEIGPIPQSWEIRPINSLVLDTETINPAKEPEKEIKYIDVSAISNEFYKVSEPTVYKGANAPGRARKLVKEYDVIVATIRPTLKRIAFIPKELDGQIASTAFCVIRANPKKASGRYLYQRVLCTDFIEALGKAQRGASYPAVTDKDVLAQTISVPHEIREQEQIADILQNIDKSIEYASSKLTIMNQLFSSTLHQLMTGKKRVKDLNIEEVLANAR